MTPADLRGFLLVMAETGALRIEIKTGDGVELRVDRGNFPPPPSAYATTPEGPNPAPKEDKPRDLQEEEELLYASVS